MTEGQAYLFLGGVAVGVLVGWIVRGGLDRAHHHLAASDRDLDRFPHVHHAPPSVQLCPRCGRFVLGPACGRA